MRGGIAYRFLDRGQESILDAPFFFTNDYPAMANLKFSAEQIQQLANQGCSASDWSTVAVHPQCNLARLHRVRFHGTVTIGANDGSVDVDGLDLPCGLYDVTIADCQIGDWVRIATIGSLISNIVVGDNVLIQNTASMVADQDAAFGNGVELDVVNEGGGRGTKILNDLTAQTAYLQAMLRFDAGFTKRFQELVDEHVKAKKSPKGRVEQGARILHCGTIRNVHIGASAVVRGVQVLEDGTILSCAEHPTIVGEGVSAHHFVIAEGANVKGGVMLDKVFVGQGTKLGKQFSAENSLFFANCEGFHGEAVSLFAGPYTVTHHKSTLLIAGIFSFYNAGSGTNQSNHMYKLGPVHQGVFERGCKTGSFSYVLLECHIGAFSVVIGKHFTNINTPNLPFSYLNEEGGVSKLTPAMNLLSVGTVRDGEKWPKRDNRKAPNKRDLIIFDVFTPYTVEKMRRGRDELFRLAETVSREKEFVVYGGVQISRLLLKKGAKYYSQAIIRYLVGKVWEKLAAALAQGKSWKESVDGLRAPATLVSPLEWTDIAGLIAPRERVIRLAEKVRDGGIKKYEAVIGELADIHRSYKADEWHYVLTAFAADFGIAPFDLTKEKMKDILAQWKQASGSMLASVLEDSKREFGALSRVGFGVDQTEEQKTRDFEAVRGTAETNSVVQKLARELAELDGHYAESVKSIDQAPD